MAGRVTLLQDASDQVRAASDGLLRAKYDLEISVLIEPPSMLFPAQIRFSLSLDCRNRSTDLL